MKVLLPILWTVAACSVLAGCAQQPEERPPFTGTWVIKGGGPSTSPAPTASTGGASEAAAPETPAGGQPPGGQPGGGATAGDEGCEGVPDGGTCAGNTLRTCVGDRVVELPCDLGGGFCVVNKVAAQATCIYPDGGNPCADMTEPSVCNQDVVLWCEDGVLKAADCTSVGKVCAYDEEQGFDACVVP